MVVGLAAAVVAGNAIVADQAGGETRVNEGFQGLVNGGQADVANTLANGGEDLLGGGMGVHGLEAGEDGGAGV